MASAVPSRVVLVGSAAGNPFAGMAWMHMQFVTGLRRLGHDAYYFEFTSDWPYDPNQGRKTDDSTYAVAYLEQLTRQFDMADRWAYRRSYSDYAWFGLPSNRAQEILRSADFVLNMSGATRLAKEQLPVGRWVYVGTDPVLHEIRYANNDPVIRSLIDEHDDVVTYGENIGTEASPLPPLPRLRARVRQPVLLDFWECGEPLRDVFTTVGNWRQVGLDITWNGETYLWSKHHEFLKFIDLPKRTDQRLELALNLAAPRQIRLDDNEAVPALGVEPEARELLNQMGWLVADGPALSLDAFRYRDYIVQSRGEFTVARDLNTRLRSGWFSERSACYLGAGRPVVTQDTGFDRVIPTGRGLFSFRTLDDILDALDRVNSNYALHSAAAREIAEEYFDADKVLDRLLVDLQTKPVSTE
jgi:hypothetical protein